MDEFNSELRTKYDNFCFLFGSTTDVIKTLPINDNLKSIIIKEFDDAFLWSKEAFTKLFDSSRHNSESKIIEFSKEKAS